MLIYKYVLMIFSMAVTRMPKTYICLPHIIRSTLTCINDIIGKAFLASTPLKTFYTSIHFWVNQLIYQILIYILYLSLQFSKGFDLANGECPCGVTVCVGTHKIQSVVQRQAVLSPVSHRKGSLGPDKIPDRRIARRPFPNTVHPHVRSREPPNVAALHLQETQLSPDKIELYLGGDFCQGASSLKLAEVVCGSPVGASRCGEEKAANVHRVTIHPPLRAAGTTGLFQQGWGNGNRGDCNKDEKWSFHRHPVVSSDRVVVYWQLYKLLSEIRREAGSIGQNTPWLWHQISHNWCWHKKDIVRIALLCIFPAIFEDFSHEMSALEDIAFLWVVYLVTQIGEHLHLLYDIAEKGKNDFQRLD